MIYYYTWGSQWGHVYYLTMAVFLFYFFCYHLIPWFKFTRSTALMWWSLLDSRIVFVIQLIHHCCLDWAKCIVFYYQWVLHGNCTNYKIKSIFSYSLYTEILHNFCLSSCWAFTLVIMTLVRCQAVTWMSQQLIVQTVSLQIIWLFLKCSIMKDVLL